MHGLLERARQPHPNAHDYEQLELFHAHGDSTSTVSSSSATKGTVVHRSDRIHSSYIVEDLAGGDLLHTFITWATKRPTR